jgi:hypothetical protein
VRQLDAEQIAHLAIEVGEAGLGAGDDADLDVALRGEALSSARSAPSVWRDVTRRRLSRPLAFMNRRSVG